MAFCWWFDQSMANENCSWNGQLNRIAGIISASYGQTSMAEIRQNQFWLYRKAPPPKLPEHNGLPSGALYR